jgi:uncharacterized membrane protein YphA (DoxX/SURF4 family)
VAELADATVSNTVEGNLVRVQVPASAPPVSDGRKIPVDVALSPVLLIVAVVVGILVLVGLATRPK